MQGYLKLVAGLREIPADQQAELISEAITVTGLTDHRARMIGHLSKGLRQRVGLAQAILHKPKFLILDEPTVGLDPTQTVEIRHLIKRLASESTVLFSSHILSEVEAVCDRVIILFSGEIKADARLDELAATNNAILVLQTSANGVEKKLSKLADVDSVEAFQSMDGWPAYRIASRGGHLPGGVRSRAQRRLAGARAAPRRGHAGNRLQPVGDSRKPGSRSRSSGRSQS